MKRAARARVHAPSGAGLRRRRELSHDRLRHPQRRARRRGAAIEFKTADALQRPPPAAAGTMMMNPPYGERIAPKGQGAAPGRRAREAFEGRRERGLLRRAGGALEAPLPGWTAWLLSPEMKLPQALMRLKESRRVPMWNGADRMPAVPLRPGGRRRLPSTRCWRWPCCGPPRWPAMR
jgi:putative N6-adenine-specific DNA methylase